MEYARNIFRTGARVTDVRRVCTPCMEMAIFGSKTLFLLLKGEAIQVLEEFFFVVLLTDCHLTEQNNEILMYALLRNVFHDISKFIISETKDFIPCSMLTFSTGNHILSFWITPFISRHPV